MPKTRKQKNRRRRLNIRKLFCVVIYRLHSPKLTFAPYYLVEVTIFQPQYKQNAITARLRN